MNMTESTITGAHFFSRVFNEIGLAPLARLPQPRPASSVRKQSPIGERLAGSPIILRFAPEVKMDQVRVSAIRKRGQVLSDSKLNSVSGPGNRLYIEIPLDFRGYIRVAQDGSEWDTLSGSRRVFEWMSRREVFWQLGLHAPLRREPAESAFVAFEAQFLRTHPEDFWPRLKRIAPAAYSHALVLKTLGLHFDCAPEWAASKLGRSLHESVQQVWPRLWNRWQRVQRHEERVWVVRTIPPDRFA
jgi:hypothetical protein